LAGLAEAALSLLSQRIKTIKSMKKSFTAKLKFWKVMKIGVTQGMFVMVFCGVVAAHPNYGQLLDRPVTVHLREVSLEEALRKIEEVTSVNFFYSIDQLDLEKRISVDVTGQTLRGVLDQLLIPNRINYRVFEKEFAIVLKKLETPPRSSAFGQNSQAPPPHLVNGTVVDVATGQPLPGVNIMVKKTTKGANTDASGVYRVQADDPDTLVFSFIGFKTFETRVGARTRIDVSLEEATASLSEVVVNAGYWKVTDKERTGNIAKVLGEDIQRQPVSNPLAALEGRVAGLDITQQTGVPGGNFKVQLRGTNSIANGNDPLYIVDGVPFTSTTMAMTATSGNILANGTSPLNGINPADIESIEVLKDADATAIYGSRGANGVILITTKKGQAGKTKVDFNFYEGAGTVTRQMDLLNTRQYVQMRKEAFAHANATPNTANAADLVSWDTTRYTNWQKKLIGGTANTIDAQVAISGGDKNTQFLIGGGYHREGTVFPGDNSDQRLATHISINNVSDNGKFRANVSLKYTINFSNFLSQDLTTRALLLPPDGPAPYDANGNLNWGSNGWSQNYPDPLSYTKTTYGAATKNLLLSALPSYALLPGLEVRANMGYTDITMDAITTIPLSSLSPIVAASSLNQSIFASTALRNWTVEPQVNWKPKLPGGKMDVLIGTTFLEQIQSGLAQYAYGFASESLMKNIAAASTITLSANSYSQYRYNAGFGRVNYVWREKYIINATGRRDGSSRFGPGKQFANFGAVGAAWLFSEEGFVKNTFSFLSFGKLRGSYGVTGNDQIGNYQYLDTYTSSGTYQGGAAITPVRLANPNFAWETNRKLEGGIELGFLNNRISTSVSYYRNRSSDQLVGFALPPTTGFNTIQGNLPALVQNKGVEILVTTKNIATAAFTWTTSLNFSAPRNRLLKFPDLANSPTYANTLVVGQPTTILKRYTYLGVNPQTGFYQFQDTNQDGAVNSLDQQQVKFIGKNYFGGMLNSFLYKQLRLDIFLQVVNQTNLNYTQVFSTAPGYQLSNQPGSVMDRWRQPGDNSETQQFTTAAKAQNTYSQFRSSTAEISDASYVRLKNLSLSWSLPQHWAQKIKAGTGQVFVRGQNLLTFTKYKGLDPETLNSTLPPLKIISLGFHLTL
jgi:TonB-linked SusC/RagA family outer membrane protein